jgi:hypothetical protein
MSAKSRARRWVQLPISQSDYVVAMLEAEDGPYDGELVVTCASGRRFGIRRVARYKRKYKVRELAQSA